MKSWTQVWHRLFTPKCIAFYLKVYLARNIIILTTCLYIHTNLSISECWLPKFMTSKYLLDLKNSYSLGISVLRKRFRPLLGFINTEVYAKWYAKECYVIYANFVNSSSPNLEKKEYILFSNIIPVCFLIDYSYV